MHIDRTVIERDGKGRRRIQAGKRRPLIEPAANPVPMELPLRHSGSVLLECVDARSVGPVHVPVNDFLA